MNTDPSNSKITSDCGEATEHKLTCAECCNQLPPTGAYRVEMDDYVHHFCGMTCYDKWRTRAGHADTGKDQTGQVAIIYDEVVCWSSLCCVWRVKLTTA